MSIAQESRFSRDFSVVFRRRFGRLSSSRCYCCCCRRRLRSRRLSRMLLTSLISRQVCSPPPRTKELVYFRLLLRQFRYLTSIRRQRCPHPLLVACLSHAPTTTPALSLSLSSPLLRRVMTRLSPAATCTVAARLLSVAFHFARLAAVAGVGDAAADVTWRASSVWRRSVVHRGGGADDC